MARILIALTSHGQLGSTGKPTGFYWEELAVPYWALRDAGHDVLMASIAGGEPPADPTSLKDNPAENPPEVTRFLTDAGAMGGLRAAPALDGAAGEAFDALFLPGGHGTMWDLPRSEALAALIARMHEEGRLIAAVCHGPAGLVAARRRDGRPIVEGRRVNGFTDSEERAAGLAEVVPFLLESRLRDLGARFDGGPDFAPFALRDGNLVTGQNPASAEPVARHMIAALRGEAVG